MKYNKKKVTRIIPETNSSSTHSVTIDTRRGLCNKNSEYWNLDIRVDSVTDKKILYVSEKSGDTDTSFFSTYRSNYCLLKILYAYGLTFDIHSITKLNTERRQLLEKVIKDVTGVDEIILEWKEKAVELLNSGRPLKIAKDTINPPTVDEDPQHTGDDVFESEETLKEFIFSPGSYISGGLNDDDAYILKEESNKEEGNSILSIYFCEPVGRIDLVISDLTFDDISLDKRINEDSEILEGLAYNIETKRIQYIQKFSSLTTTFGIVKVDTKWEKCLLNLKKVKEIDNEFFLEMYSDTIPDTILFKMELISEKYGKIF